jgi:hypothetical protein
MTFPLGYHSVVKCVVKSPVRRSIPASLALFAMLFLPLLLVSISSAQINGTPPSVTSAGFGGRAINGTPPSVTSLGRNGFAPPNAGVSFSTNFPFSGNGHHHHHHTANASAYYPYVYALPVPYAVDVNDAATEDDDDEYQGGPTIFDRRGSGRDSYIPPSYAGPAHARPAAQAGSMQADAPPAAQSAAELASEPPQPPTTLVFKNGHQLEVENYAIVSQTLYDLTPGHPRKIALADLDIPATQKQNDDRGVAFQLPPSAQAN